MTDVTTTPPFTIDEFRQMNPFERMMAKNELTTWRDTQRLKCKRAHNVYMQKFYVRRLGIYLIFTIDGVRYRHNVFVTRSGETRDSIYTG